MQYFDTDDFEYEDEDIQGEAQHFSSVILLAVFAAAVVAMWALILIRPDRSFSENENRSLAQRPHYALFKGISAEKEDEVPSLVEKIGDGTDTEQTQPTGQTNKTETTLLQGIRSGSLFEEMGDWITDQFPMRDLWMRVSFTARSLLGQKEFSDVYIGEDGYLISIPQAPDLNKNEKTIDAVSRFLARHNDIPASIMIVPGAAGVLTGKLPKNAPIRDETADIWDFQDKLYTAAKAAGAGELDLIDAASILKEHSEEYIYYRTDHHWTSYGAYLAFQGSTQALGIEPVLEYLTYPVSDTFQGTLASKSGDLRSNDIVSIYEPQNTDVLYYVNYPATQTRRPSVYEPDALAEKDHYTVFFGGNHSVVEIVTTAQTDRNLLVFKDSYANCYVPFLIPYFDRIIMVDPRYYYDNIDLTMSSYGITDILFLYSADQLLHDTALADTLG